MVRFEPLVLHFSPERFNAIQVRAIGGQEPNVEVFGLPFDHFCFHHRRVMKRGIVQYHNGFARYVGCKIVQASPQQFCRHRSSGFVAFEVIGARQEAEHVAALTSLRGDCRVLAAGLPTVGHARVEGKTACVAKIHLQVLLVFELEQGFEFSRKARVFRFVLLGLEPLTQAVPGVLQFFFT